VRLLVTRAEPDAERTAATLRARGCDVLVAALTRIEPLAADFGQGPWEALALSSANAARALAKHPRRAELLSLPVFVVGRHTGATARAAGFANVHSADRNAGDLARLIAARLDPGSAILYLAGEDRARDLAEELADHALKVETGVIYRAAAASNFPAEAAAALAAGALDGVLHYSRRSARIYVQCGEIASLRAQALAPVHYCLSARVAEPLVAAGAGDVGIAARPVEGALIDLVVIS
jgi:uroporphyrinogen-III synthase